MDEDFQIEIETRLAYQEKIIKELNDVVCGQQRAIETLETLCNTLAKRLDGLARMTSGSSGPADEKPPHY